MRSANYLTVIEIDKNGFLSLSRNGVMRPQYCYRQQGIKRCGDWCPCFSEPYTEKIHHYNGNQTQDWGHHQVLELSCVEISMNFAGKVIDKRPRGENIVLPPEPKPDPPKARKTRGNRT